MSSRQPFGELAAAVMRRAMDESNGLQRRLLLEEALRLHRLAMADGEPALADKDEAVRSPAEPPEKPAP